jgi:glycosyltransferase 2 family protein
MENAARKGLLIALTAASIALFVLVAHPRRLASSLASLPPTAALTAVGATMAGVMLVAIRWRTILAARSIEAPAARLFAALTIGSAVNNVLPARAGDAVRVESAHRLTGAPRLAIGAALLYERVLDGLVLAALVVTGALCTHARGPFLWVGIGLAGALVVVLPLIPVFRTRRMLGALGVSAGIWFADVVMYGALAHGFHLDVSLGALLLLVGAGNLALAIPGTAAGLGSFELVTLAGAHGIGVGGPSLAAFVLAAHAVIVLPTTLTGMVLARAALPGVLTART